MSNKPQDRDQEEDVLRTEVEVCDPEYQAKNKGKKYTIYPNTDLKYKTKKSSSKSSSKSRTVSFNTPSKSWSNKSKTYENRPVTFLGHPNSSGKLF